MPIEVVCPSCTRQFRVPDKVAGKKIKCPKCAGVLPVPGTADSGTGSAVGGGSSVSASGNKWYLKTPDGSQYGPVPKPELDQWLAEGRITADCQLLVEGSPQWQWSTDLYPQLDTALGTTSQTAASSSVPMQAPLQTTGDNPFAGLGGNDSAPADNPFAALDAESKVSAAAPSGGAVNPAGGTTGGSEPFSFAGADTSPTSRVRGGGKRRGGKRRRGAGSGKRSGIVTAVAVVNYIVGGLLFLACIGGLVMALGIHAAVDQAASQNGADPNAIAAAKWIGGGVMIAFAVIGMLGSLLMLAAGYGVQQRESWGRLLTIVLGIGTLLGGNLLYSFFVLFVLFNKEYAEEFG